MFCAKARDRDDPTLGSDPVILKTRVHLHKAAAPAAAMEEWQAEWDRSPPTGWVRRLVPAVSTFVDASGLSVIADYWSMQLLTGHGSFRQFIHRIGKAPSEACLDCGAARDDAEHVLTACPEFAPPREVLAAGLGAPVEVSTLVPLATSSAERWTAFRDFAASVMGARQAAEVEADRLLRAERARLAQEAAAERARVRLRLARKRKRVSPR